MPKMRAVQVSKANGPLELVEREIPSPAPGTVRVKVKACGVCHSDSLVKEGAWPGLEYPRVPGHEVIGLIDAIGAGVAGWKEGERVGVGWNGGYCGYCDNCRKGNFFACQNISRVTGVTTDGGYADYMIAHASGLARVPAELGDADAAPLMCAGVTTFNALRNSGVRPGEVAAVSVSAASATWACNTRPRWDSRPSPSPAAGQGAARQELGAWKYIDNQATDPAAELAKLGGAKVILATVTVADAMKSVIGGLAVNGTMMLIGAVPTLEIPPLFLLIGEPLRQRLVFGSLDGFPGNARLQPAFRRALDERGLSRSKKHRRPTSGCRAAKRGSAGAHDGKLTGH